MTVLEHRKLRFISVTNGRLRLTIPRFIWWNRRQLKTSFHSGRDMTNLFPRLIYRWQTKAIVLPKKAASIFSKAGVRCSFGIGLRAELRTTYRPVSNRCRQLPPSKSGDLASICEPGRFSCVRNIVRWPYDRTIRLARNIGDSAGVQRRREHHDLAEGAGKRIGRDGPRNCVR